MHSVRLATWNVLNGTGLLDGRVDVARLGSAAAGLRADVLALQEVDRGQPRSHGVDLVQEVAAASGAAHWRFEPSLVGTPGSSWRPARDGDGPASGPSYGVGLVSAWPVRSWQVLRMAAARTRAPVLLPGTRQVIWIRDEPRIVLAAAVDGPLGPMTVAATHLSFVPGWNLLQLQRLSRWLRRLPGPYVLLGDLNMPAVPVRAASAWRVLGQGPTYPANDPKVQLDHVLGRGTLPPVVGVERPALPVSDHRPLVVELRAG